MPDLAPVRSYVKFRQPSDGNSRNPCGGRPTTRDPGQVIQSTLPLLYTMHVVLCMERTSWLSHVMLILRMQGKGAAEGEVSREREASRKDVLHVSACWPFEVKVSSFPQR